MLDRFWAKVRKTPTCWIWTGATLKKEWPYGVFGTRGKITSLAHRISWELHHRRPVPETLQVLHRCDNPRCVRPKHLFVGTQADNLRDMTKKGRRVESLTFSQVRMIRRWYATGRYTQRGLARMFRVTQCQIHNIVTKKQRISA